MRKELHYSFKIDTIYNNKDHRMVLTMKGKRKEDNATSPSIWENGIFEVGDSIVKKKILCRFTFIDVITFYPFYNKMYKYRVI